MTLLIFQNLATALSLGRLWLWFWLWPLPLVINPPYCILAIFYWPATRATDIWAQKWYISRHKFNLAIVFVYNPRLQSPPSFAALIGGQVAAAAQIISPLRCPCMSWLQGPRSVGCKLVHHKLCKLAKNAFRLTTQLYRARLEDKVVAEYSRTRCTICSSYYVDCRQGGLPRADAITARQFFKTIRRCTSSWKWFNALTAD